MKYLKEPLCRSGVVATVILYLIPPQGKNMNLLSQPKFIKKIIEKKKKKPSYVDSVNLLNRN